MPGQFCVIAPDVKLGRDVVIYNFVNLYGCEIGDGTRIGSFVEIQKGALVGRNCKISSHTFICEVVALEDVEVIFDGRCRRVGIAAGATATGLNHVVLAPGSGGAPAHCHSLEEEVFVGHGVIFINDKHPRATNAHGALQSETDWQVVPTMVKRGVSIGSGATIMCGVTIGAGATVGAGAIVTKDVSEGATVAGNPARTANRFSSQDTP